MTYQPKFQQCPYRTSDGRCTHKTPNNKKTKVRRVCGYKHPKNCDMYCEWKELYNDTILIQKSSDTPLKSKLGTSHK